MYESYLTFIVYRVDVNDLIHVRYQHKSKVSYFYTMSVTARQSNEQDSKFSSIIFFGIETLMGTQNDDSSLKFKIPDKHFVENVIHDLLSACRNNADYFSHDNSDGRSGFDGIFRKLSERVESSVITVRKIEGFAGLYDFDEKSPGNGYWSFVFIYEAALIHARRVCVDVIDKRDSWFFRRNVYVKYVSVIFDICSSAHSCICLSFREVQVCAQIFESLHQICKNLLLIHDISKNGDLYSEDRTNKNIITNSLRVIDQTCFHGRASGFQFADSLKPIMRFLDTVMTSYSNLYFTEGSKVVKLTNYLIALTKYSFDPDARAERFVDATHNGSIDFCKSWWQLGESKFVQFMPSIFGRNVDVSHGFGIDAVSMRIYSRKYAKDIDIDAPTSHTGLRPISVRLISARRRGNMIGQTSSMNELSESIIIHVSLLSVEFRMELCLTHFLIIQRLSSVMEVVGLVKVHDLVSKTIFDNN